jgi:hypothetical protein
VNIGDIFIILNWGRRKSALLFFPQMGKPESGTSLALGFCTVSAQLETMKVA